MGEYYTPDWLVDFTIKESNYEAGLNTSLLDPTCGSGTFLTHAINKFREKINSKIIIKPNDGVASIGVMSVDKGENRDAEIVDIINSCSNKEVVVEEFFEGQEYAYEGYLKEGELKTIVIFEKPGDYSGPYFEEKIFIAPSDIDTGKVDEIQKVCQSACTELGLTFGPVHIEFKIINNKIHLIKIMNNKTHLIKIMNNKTHLIKILKNKI